MLLLPFHRLRRSRLACGFHLALRLPAVLAPRLLLTARRLPALHRPVPGIAALAFLALSACTSGGGPLLYAVPPAPVTARVPVSFASVEVIDVTLPTYAQTEEIALGLATGAIQTRKDLLWADLPARAVTLDLTRALGLVTGAQVASSPWPFDRSPDARLEVRIEEFLPAATGTFRLSGQYFVGAFDGSDRARARAFALSVPFDPAGGVPAIAAARGAATVQLAETIARDGLR